MVLPKIEIRYTIEDYKQWEGDWELIEGVPYAMAPSPFGRYQQILSVLIRQFEGQFEDCSEGCFVYPELDWIVDQETVVHPDLVVVCHLIEEYLLEPPLIVLEVVSPKTARKDEILKFSLYERERVKYYILVYPELKKARIFTLRAKKFEKVFDGSEGTFEFEDLPCRPTLDFDRLWRRTNLAEIGLRHLQR
jgi:Uma2 family endonuclease